uniref:Uncharacterized protein n=1 Tax=Tanacetum cinerariifolium TaxID=118510 RepID=A0A699HQL4_TANCI|nr:hypothetical protein [Tanacetum cinerariifolium]
MLEKSYVTSRLKIIPLGGSNITTDGFQPRLDPSDCLPSGSKLVPLVPLFGRLVYEILGSSELAFPVLVLMKFSITMHIRIDMSFLLRKRIRSPQGDEPGRIKPLLRRSCSFPDNSRISDDAKRYGALATGVALDTKSIWNSTCLGG